MHAELRSIGSTDCDPECWRPVDEAWAITLRMEVGIAGDAEGSDGFMVIVCSPAWIAKQLESDDIVSGQFHYMSNGFNFRAISTFFSKIVGSCSGSTVEEIMTKVSRLAHWGFAS